MCSSVFLSMFEFPVCRAACPAFKVPFPPSVSFLKFWSEEEFSFPWRNNPDFFCVVLFSSAGLLEDVLTAVVTCSRIFSAFKRDLFVFRSRCDTTCLVLQCWLLCWNFLYMWHSHRTNAQTICPIILFRYCWKPESLPIVSSLSGGCFGKTLPWSLWHLSSPSASLLVACPVQNNLEISLNCCTFFNRHLSSFGKSLPSWVSFWQSEGS